MGLVYVFALVVGLGILGLQTIFGGKGGGHDVGDHGDASGEELTTDDGVGKPMGESFDFVAFFLSFRFWIFASLAFGMSGVVLHYLALTTPLIVFLLAVGSGLGAGLFASFAFRYISRSSVSSTADVTTARGSIGRVLVPVGKDQKGQIRIVLRGQTVDLIATTDGEALERGDEVIVEEIDGGNTARVSKSPSELG
jgi:membrane protein implicated in regulation of membrane protease activity